MWLLRIYRRTRVRHNETCWGQDTSFLWMLEPQGEPRVRQSQAKAKEIRWMSSRLPGDYPDTLAIWQFTNKWRLIRTRGVGFIFFSTLKPPNRSYADPNPREHALFKKNTIPVILKVFPVPHRLHTAPIRLRSPFPKILMNTTAVLSSIPITPSLTRAVQPKSPRLIKVRGHSGASNHRKEGKDQKS